MDQPELHNDPRLFARYRWLYLAAVVLIFAVGLGIRLYDLTDAPLDFHPTRQLYSAIKARGMYYEQLETAPQWQRDFAVQQWQVQGLIEPPIMEQLAAFTYRLVGQELLWIPRLFAIFFWTIGGLFLLWTAKELLDENAAVFALLYFMVMPYTAAASRAFQPDPLMVSLMIIALWSLVRWMHTQRMRFAVLAGLFGGFAIFIKLVVVFPIVAAFVVVTLGQLGLRNVWRNHQVWMMGVLAILPYALYHIYGMYIVHQLQSQFSLRFFPQLWSDPGFWLRWNGMISQVVGFEFFLAALVGIALLRTRLERAFLAALFGGYFVYGLALSYHISSHDYYQLPLVPVVALGVAAVFAWVVRSVQEKQLGALLLSFVLLYMLAINAWDVRVALKRAHYKNEVAFWTSLSTTFEPGDRVIGITQDYGYRMIYWGWHYVENWKSSADFALRELDGQEFDMEKEFYNAIEGQDFFLVTQPDELAHQPKVKQLLTDNFPVLEETDNYLIYDLRQPVEKQAE
ncbi:MAG: hypothetical protein CVU39_04295 [Chloroflexi bacterium HGW-Chloroflexi-10]|nr:MAG: hypothetical protein CVU39_04295 [Chloroflexi bacterium HGW-Chloroflexi-10]